MLLAQSQEYNSSMNLTSKKLPLIFSYSNNFLFLPEDFGNKWFNEFTDEDKYIPLAYGFSIGINTETSLTRNIYFRLGINYTRAVIQYHNAKIQNPNNNNIFDLLILHKNKINGLDIPLLFQYRICSKNTTNISVISGMINCLPLKETLYIGNNNNPQKILNSNSSMNFSYLDRVPYLLIGAGFNYKVNNRILLAIEPIYAFKFHFSFYDYRGDFDQEALFKLNMNVIYKF